MAAPTVYDDVAKDADVQGQLFSGKSFWVAQRVPMRTHFLDQIKSNGGTVTGLEKKADYMIVDHFRRDCPPGSISYTFIEKSIKAGELQNPKRHLAGPPVGSASEGTARRSNNQTKRVKFTAEEDRILYKWVRDCEGKGGAADGNVIYKQLEAIHPEHPWQSWRDRYRKHLRDRPPSAFNIPDNAPPSPPTDDPKAEPVATGSANPVAKEAAVSSNKDIGTAERGTISLVDLGKLFNTEEWEELYAFKESIEGITGDAYINAWKAWAEGKPQTAKQWQEYFERVVKPQWDSDPEVKHQEVKRRVEKRLESSQEEASEVNPDENMGEKEKAESIQNQSTTAPSKRKRDDAEDSRLAVAAGEDTSNTVESMVNSQVQLSSSTTADKTPEDIAEINANGTKPIDLEKHTAKPKRIETEATHVESSPPAKKRKSAHASASSQRTPRPTLTDMAVPAGTRIEPFEFSSPVSSSSPSELDPNEAIKNGEQRLANPDSDIFNSDAVTPADSNDYPSNTPTPRASRVRSANAFNTQAILSSPLPSSSISPLPLPKDMSQDSEDDYADGEEQDDDQGDSTLVPLSPAFEPPSDTSTTHSMQEFRQSLNSPLHDPIHHHDEYIRNPNDLEQPQSQPLTTLHLSSSPPPSSPASTTSTTSTTSSQIDPDPPLTSLEIEDFFTTHHAKGHSDAVISAALKRTRCRPGLAALVLDRWANGDETPRNTRGVWTEKDDVDVESGDAAVLKRLEERHSMDGWGGVMERLRFLAQYRGE